ncbi:MAG TPA: hypothetical protein VHA52_05720 [Candidatus Babeliaceae bacterium]|nr:hypothetical protein [Candidatus Babeliaceae bacterium]
MKSQKSIAEKKQELITNLMKCGGIVTIACLRSNVGRTMFYEYINTDPEFAANVEQVQDAFLDYAESRLFDLMLTGDRAAIMFFLKAKGKNRGYR